MMGMYDTVYFTCPNCGKTFEEQSKCGDCVLNSFQSHSVPVDIANSFDGKTIYCEHCGTKFVCYSHYTTKAIELHKK
jgi:ribosomal protein L31